MQNKASKELIAMKEKNPESSSFTFKNQTIADDLTRRRELTSGPSAWMMTILRIEVRPTIGRLLRISRTERVFPLD